MEYDFSALCADQIEKLEKRLESINKSFIKEYFIALNVINNKNVNNYYDELKTKIMDLLNDSKNKSTISYKQCMNKIQANISEYIK